MTISVRDYFNLDREKQSKLRIRASPHCGDRILANEELGGYPK